MPRTRFSRLEEPRSRALYRPANSATVRSRCVALPVALPKPEHASPWLKEQRVADEAQWWRLREARRCAPLSTPLARAELVARYRQALAARDFDAF